MMNKMKQIFCTRREDKNKNTKQSKLTFLTTIYLNDEVNKTNQLKKIYRRKYKYKIVHINLFNN